MPPRERPADRRATLYARGDLPRAARERRDDVAERLADIAASGSLDAFDVVHWAKRVPLASDESAEGRRGDARTAGGSSRERSLVAEFHEWATDAGVELAPCFEMRRCYAERSVEKRTELVLPVLCLAVYEGERLVELAPHATAEGVVTVTDSLERLENDERDGRERESMVPPAD